MTRAGYIQRWRRIRLFAMTALAMDSSAVMFFVLDALWHRGTILGLYAGACFMALGLFAAAMELYHRYKP